MDISIGVSVVLECVQTTGAGPAFLCRSLIGQLSAMKERKTNYLLAIKRELLSELLVIEWMEVRGSGWSVHTLA